MPVARPANRVKAKAARILPSTMNQKDRIYFNMMPESERTDVFLAFKSSFQKGLDLISKDFSRYPE